MATVSVITLAALTAYIVVGLLALARVPDAGGPGRRLIQLAFWPAVVVRAAASPSHRHARQAPPEVAAPELAQPVVAHSGAAHVAAAVAAVAAPPEAGDVPAVPAPAPAPATRPDAPAAAAAPTTTPSAPPPDAVPVSPSRDLRSDWERFVLRLTEPSE